MILLTEKTRSGPLDSFMSFRGKLPSNVRKKRPEEEASCRAFCQDSDSSHSLLLIAEATSPSHSHTALFLTFPSSRPGTNPIPIQGEFKMPCPDPFRSVVPRTSSFSISRHLLEIQNLRPDSSPTEPESVL